MRSTIVPAQVTTVEDRIAGNLGMTQVVLLVAPLFLYFGIHLLVPPFSHNSNVKTAITLTLSIITVLSAIRVRGTLLIFRLTAVVRYCFRPRYYVFDKHSSFARIRYLGPEALIDSEQQIISTPVRDRLQLSTAQVVRLERLLTDSTANVRFDNTKGGLRVRLTEIKEES